MCYMKILASKKKKTVIGYCDPLNTCGKNTVIELIENKMTYLIKSFKYFKCKIQLLKVLKLLKFSNYI